MDWSCSAILKFMLRICIVLLMTLLMLGAAQARMYQWVDPRTRHTQMSGTPPAWYRSGQPGPRVFVFENGQIIDDTLIAVSDDRRQALREEAFKNVSPISTAPETATGDTATSAEPGVEMPATSGEADTASAPAAAPAPAANTPTPKNVSPEVLAKLKEALERWDQVHPDLSIPPPTSASSIAPVPGHPSP
jgi:hypothetical protein